MGSEKTILSAYVPTAQRDRLADLAAANERSLSGEVRRALDTYLRLNTDFSAASSTSAPPFAMTAGEGRGSFSAVAPVANRRDDAA